MKLYEINKLLTSDKLFKAGDNYVNSETGEVFDQAYIDSLPMAQEEKTKNVALVIKDMTGEVTEIDKEIMRLLEMKKVRENRIKSLKNYILHFGTAVNDVAVTVRFNKGRESLRFDDGFDVRSIGSAFYKTTVKPDNKAIMAALKDGKKIEGVEIIRKPFVVIK